MSQDINFLFVKKTNIRSAGNQLENDIARRFFHIFTAPKKNWKKYYSSKIYDFVYRKSGIGMSMHKRVDMTDRLLFNGTKPSRKAC